MLGKSQRGKCNSPNYGYPFLFLDLSIASKIPVAVMQVPKIIAIFEIAVFSPVFGRVLPSDFALEGLEIVGIDLSGVTLADALGFAGVALCVELGVVGVGVGVGDTVLL